MATVGCFYFLKCFFILLIMCIFIFLDKYLKNYARTLVKLARTIKDKKKSKLHPI